MALIRPLEHLGLCGAAVGLLALSPPAWTGDMISLAPSEQTGMGEVTTSGTRLDEDADAEKPPETLSMAARLEASQAVVSDSLDSMARKIDTFFEDERYITETAATRLRLGLYTFSEQGEQTRLRTRLNLSVKLPKLNRKVKLFFSSEDEDDGVAQEGAIVQSIETRSNESLAGLRFYAKALERLNLSMAVGVKVEGADLFAGPRLRYTQPLGDGWRSRFTQRVIYITQRGWESSTRLDLERAFSSRLLLRHTFDGRWREEDPGYRLEFGTTLFHQLPNSVAVAYRWSNQFRTRPRHKFDQYVLSAQIRKHIWRKWLFFEVTPQVAFYNDDDFNPTPGITVGMEVIFGSK
jgi:hypothetical protein